MNEEGLPDIPRLLGQNVKKFRKTKGLTQEQLSERLGITQKHLSVVETGTQFASASLISKLCKELNVTPGMLFGGDMTSQQIATMQTTFLNLLNVKIENLYRRLHREIEELKPKNDFAGF